jgi:hypothetical protein
LGCLLVLAAGQYGRTRDVDQRARVALGEVVQLAVGSGGGLLVAQAVPVVVVDDATVYFTAVDGRGQVLVALVDLGVGLEPLQPLLGAVDVGGDEGSGTRGHADPVALG